MTSARLRVAGGAVANKPHHQGDHHRRAAAVVRKANADPTYRCPTCGLTRADGIAQWGKQGEWEGGHRVSGDPRYGYYAQHRHCNRSLGAREGNAKRRQKPDQRTEWW